MYIARTSVATKSLLLKSYTCPRLIILSDIWGIALPKKKNNNNNNNSSLPVPLRWLPRSLSSRFSDWMIWPSSAKIVIEDGHLSSLRRHITDDCVTNLNVV